MLALADSDSPRGQRVVVVEVALLLLARELVAEQEHGEHHVGLLHHLEAVDDQGGSAQQQRKRSRGVPSRSHTTVQKGGIPRMDAARRVVGHAIAAAARSRLDLLGPQLDLEDRGAAWSEGRSAVISAPPTPRRRGSGGP